ncbi:MAG TPA: hypothetical protein VFL80_11670 [Thermoanaerobaculia bacterium]|nr:hypothetical protein [Thermoanaerobaculia bacterium]
MKSFPPDILVLDAGSLLHARFGRGKSTPRLVHAKSYRLPADTFSAAPVSPLLTNESGLAEALRRLRVESGTWQRASLLLPDSWFRMNLVDLPSFNEHQQDALEVVRWSLKRTLPVPPEDLRVAYEVITRTPTSVKLLVISALETTLAAVERVFTAANLDVVLIEPLGLNLWNAVAVREPDSDRDRLLLYVRDDEFTTAVFRGSRPMFLRSRNLAGDRSLQQEIRLSATYLRDTLGTDGYDACYLAGSAIPANLGETIASEFRSPVRTISLRDFVEQVPADLPGAEAELAACTGVFTL